jgi:hypothetical protein
MKIKAIKINYYFLACAWALFVLIATLTSSGTLSKFNLSALFGFDKPIHFVLFGMQAWLLIKARIKNNTTPFIKIVFTSCFISALYGITTEILQGIFVWLGRGFDYDDMIADALGCLLVYVWFWLKRKQFAQ